jgi:16S rRNA (guanine527-N7)-methyltransferase
MTLLEKGIREIGLEYSIHFARQLEIYQTELHLWRRKGLVNAEGDDLIVRHFLDCLAGFPFFPDMTDKTVADLGSGAGFPGLLAAIYFRNTKIDLIERQAGRAAFLINCVSLLGLNDRVRVLECDASDLKDKYDYFIFRAFRPFDKMSEYFISKVKDGTVLLAYKGKLENAKQDLIVMKDFEGKAIPLSVPFLNEQRHLLIIK